MATIKKETDIEMDRFYKESQKADDRIVVEANERGLRAQESRSCSSVKSKINTTVTNIPIYIYVITLTLSNYPHHYNSR